MVGLAEMLKEGEPLMRQAMDAVRRYHEARDSSLTDDEVDRLRAIAEALMRELRDFQVGVIGKIGSITH
ncbi:hypothetical protein [Pseudomonas sp. Marseille-P9899]|uniref:hypothetical protein n=1 Tax=Pseudomonas sp. Marseille-P9899 TaxID=2730401 RepID=UPI00158836A7|nr:hypothetical protein [Pseudomonas sp. Marseille-P9899]